VGIAGGIPRVVSGLSIGQDTGEVAGIKTASSGSVRQGLWFFESGYGDPSAIIQRRAGCVLTPSRDAIAPVLSAILPLTARRGLSAFWFDPDSIIHGEPDALLAAEIPFCGLD